MNKTAQSSGDDDLKRLKDLLLGEESRQIDELKQHLENPELHAADVGRVLHQAVQLNQQQQPGDLTAALSPVVESSLYASVRTDPDRLGDALFPVMAPAIRKSITSIMRGMMDSLNHMLENSFSLRGLKWRIESLHTGKSFAEIVMLNTLDYRVEQVFLIHKADGLLLQHVSFMEGDTEHADLVSGMLTAIQDFVRDSFQVEENDSIEKLNIGNMVVYIEAGSRAVLAAVVRGNAPAEFREMLQQRCESIHKAMAAELESFDGDAAVFNTVRPEMESCLLSKTASSSSGSNFKAKFVIVMLLLALLGWSGWVWYQTDREQVLIEALDAIPGVTVIRTVHEQGALNIIGMRDPLSDDPDDLLQQYGYADDKVLLQWTPYQSLLPALQIRRAKQVLKPGSETQLELDETALIVSGTATRSWLDRAMQMLPALPGITALNSADLVISDSSDYLLTLAIQQLEPPQAVHLSISGATLIAEGKAANAWVKRAAAITTLIPEIKSYDDSKLVDIESDSYLLSEVIRKLKPPESTKVSLRRGLVSVRGKASSEWIGFARKRIKRITGITGFNTDALMDTGSNTYIMANIRRELQPPKSVSLSLVKGALTVSGIASARWAGQAAAKVQNIEGVKVYKQQGLVVADKALAMLKKALNTVQLSFAANSSQLIDGEADKIFKLADLLLKHSELLRLSKAHVQVTGYSRLYGGQAGALALNRAKNVRKKLVEHNVPARWVKVDGLKIRSLDWSAGLDLVWERLP